MDTVLFQNACDKIINNERSKNSIGRLGEKTVHAVLKNYFEPNEKKHEIKVESFIADIYTKQRIIEIQTRNFNAIRKKLKIYLKQHSVMIVYPIPYHKWIYWINEETGEITNKRKSPKAGTAYMSFYELYKIKEFLDHPNLSICIMLINMEEYRLLNGWSEDKKRGSCCYDRIPIELVEEIYIQNTYEYKKLIPLSLDEIFTSKDFKKESHLSLSCSQIALNVLNYVGAVERIGKQGRLFSYRIK